MLFKLKVGTHMEGTIADEKGKNTVRVWKAKGPNNIVESDQDLAQMDPDRFEVYHGPAPQQRGMRLGGPVLNEERPPGPPGEKERAEAALMRPMTIEDRRRQAEWYRQQADELEMAATEAERNMEISKQQEEYRTPSTSEESKEESPSKASSTVVVEKPPSSKKVQSGIPNDSELNQMNKEKLLEVAEREEVEVTDHDTRADILRKLRAARSG